MSKTKLYLLKARKDFTGYVMNQNIVVRAESEKEARSLAAQDERNDRWNDDAYASCDILTEDGAIGVVIVDNNGS